MLIACKHAITFIPSGNVICSDDNNRSVFCYVMSYYDLIFLIDREGFSAIHRRWQQQFPAHVASPAWPPVLQLFFGSQQCHRRLSDILRQYRVVTTKNKYFIILIFY